MRRYFGPGPLKTLGASSTEPAVAFTASGDAEMIQCSVRTGRDVL
jgi:hypothetical protein